MRFSFYALTLVGAALLSGQPVVAGNSTRLESSINAGIAIESSQKQCESLLYSLTKSSESLLEECLKSSYISQELKQDLQALNETILETDDQLIAQAQPLTLESLQRQIDALRNKIVQLESQAVTTASVAEQRELELEQTVAELTKEVNTLKVELESDGKSIAKGQGCGGTCRWREVKGAGFNFDTPVNVHIRGERQL